VFNCNVALLYGRNIAKIRVFVCVLGANL
jgi:hypothetical protein